MCCLSPHQESTVEDVRVEDRWRVAFLFDIAQSLQPRTRVRFDSNYLDFPVMFLEPSSGAHQSSGGTKSTDQHIHFGNLFNDLRPCSLIMSLGIHWIRILVEEAKRRIMISQALSIYN